jgi:hypothetical protein
MVLKQRLTPQERWRLIGELFRRVRHQPDLTPAQRQEIRRRALNLHAVPFIRALKKRWPPLAG